MPTLKALALEQSLPDADPPAVCALVGDDDSLLSRSLAFLSERAAPADLPGSTLRRFEESPEPGVVFDDLRTIPFMGLAGRRCVAIERADAFLAANWQGVGSFLANPPGTSTLILCLTALNAKSPPARSGGAQADAKERAAAWRAFVKALSTDGLIVDCSKVRWQDAKAWLAQQAAALGRKLTPQAVDTLVEAVGPNLMALQNELDKLCAYAGTRDTITEGDVGELVAEARSRSVFDLAEAVGRGDAAGALRLCAQLRLSGESREGIISVLAMQLRRLWQMKRLHAAGAREAQIAADLGIPPFAVRRAARTLPILSEDRLGRQLCTLADADVESKTASLRVQEEGVWLEGLLARLCEQGGAARRNARGTRRLSR